jgi:hypothetical protein
MPAAVLTAEAVAATLVEALVPNPLNAARTGFEPVEAEAGTDRGAIGTRALDAVVEDETGAIVAIPGGGGKAANTPNPLPLPLLLPPRVSAVADAGPGSTEGAGTSGPERALDVAPGRVD